MKLLTFSHGKDTIFGAKVGSHVINLPELVALSEGEKNGFPQDMASYFAAGDAAKKKAQRALATIKSERIAELVSQGVALEEAKITYLPPIASPGKIICLGMNYRQHAQEMGREPPKYPTLFGKFSHTLIGHKQEIVLPMISDMVDYEAELALVIGREGKAIKAENALDFIGGYTILNDVSVRDFQNRTLQWLQGKNFDRSCPIGPYVVTADEVADPDKLDIELKLNDKVMQHSNTSDFIFSVPVIIEYISQIMTLSPGDIISTGTPSGVGVARDPQVFLKAGDTVKIKLEKVGMLENPVFPPAD